MVDTASSEWCAKVKKKGQRTAAPRKYNPDTHLVAPAIEACNIRLVSTKYAMSQLKLKCIFFLHTNTTSYLVVAACGKWTITTLVTAT